MEQDGEFLEENVPSKVSILIFGLMLLSSSKFTFLDKTDKIGWDGHKWWCKVCKYVSNTYSVEELESHFKEKHKDLYEIAIIADDKGDNDVE